jgi:hypothetical protein
MLNAKGESSMQGEGGVAELLLHMSTDARPSTRKPYDIHERLLDFACEVVRPTGQDSRQDRSQCAPKSSVGSLPSLIHSAFGIEH